jgi:hypothetical protein
LTAGIEKFTTLVASAGTNSVAPLPFCEFRPE